MGVIMPVGFGIVSIKVAIQNQAKVFVTTFGFDGDVSEDPVTDASEVNVILKATGRPFLPANYSSSYVYLGVDVVRMTATGPISGSAPESIVGTASTNPMPSNCAILMSKVTSRGGRKGKGRCYLPPAWLLEANIDPAGIIQSSVLTPLQALWSSAFTALAASDVKPVLLHSDGSTPDLCTAWTLQPLIATQRRRMRS